MAVHHRDGHKAQNKSGSLSKIANSLFQICLGSSKLENLNFHEGTHFGIL